MEQNCSVELDEETQELLTISTHKGLYRPTRLQYGVHSATGIFQRIMEQRLASIPMTKVRVDILISGLEDDDHIQNLREVLERLSESGLTVNLPKCAFLQPEVGFCGHMINKDGTRPMHANVEAVREARIPTNVPAIEGISWNGELLSFVSS